MLTGNPRKSITVPLVILTLAIVSQHTAMAYESAFPSTPAGTTEVKTLPSGILLKSTAEGSYFDNGGSLFRPLFRYISSHQISMTVPVEATIDDAAMYFWVAENEAAKVTGDENGVEVVHVPERQVVSRGGRGSYSARNFEKTRDELLAWIESHPDLKIAGEPYAVYWNGPFTPWFAKRFEVHLEITPVPPPIAALND
jgi:effector-binding domain-containing protein